MNILDQIVKTKQEEIAENKASYPIRLLEKSIYFSSTCVSLKEYIQREDKSGIIAEFKRASPSKGVINAHADVEKTTIGYMQAGASALSVLTDKSYFGGSNQDLTIARKFNYCPILRKDFILDEYQIIEAKSIGADAILLIARILDKERVKQLTNCAKDLGLEILLEIHHENELDVFDSRIDLVGINNRNLESFDVDFDHAIALANQLPNNVVKIAESGIHSPEDINLLRANGFEGFLIGERFMRNADPQVACKKFIKQIKERVYETA